MNIVTNEMIDFKNQIKRGEIVPTKNSVAHIEMKDNSINFCFQNLEFKENDLVSVFFYDKKKEKILAFAEVDAADSNAVVKISDVTVNALGKADYKYARVCIAVKSGKKCICSYISEIEECIKNNNKPEYSLGMLENSSDSSSNVLVYFSAGGLLSIKSDGYEKEELLTSVLNNMTVKSVSFKDNCIVVEREYIGNDYLFRNAKIVFDCANGSLVFTERSAEYDEENNITKIVSEFSMENIDLYGKMKLSCSFGGESTAITFENRGMLSGFNNNHNFKIRSNNKDRIVVFNLEFSQLTMIVCRKYYNSVIAVIMAVYNTEQFLEEAIESILAQKTDRLKAEVDRKLKAEPDVYYKNLYELILVDDGSEDGSGSICDKYADSYPQITVIHKENGGVSSARNAGIKASNAKYLNFMDSDDKFSENVFEECFTFFENHYDEITVVTFPLKFFDASTGDHWLNYKFSSQNKIVDMRKNPDVSTIFVNATFFKSEDIISNNHFFDVNLVNGEDIKFIYLLYSFTKPVVGLIPNAVYWYRRRSAGEESAIQASKKTPSFYNERLNNLFVYLKDYYISKYNELPLFVQHMFMQQLQWLFIQDTDGAIARTIVSEEEYEAYKNIIFSLIQYIDASVILKQKKLYREQKYYVISLKENGTYKEYTDNDIKYMCSEGEISKASLHYVRPEFMKINNGVLSLEGYSMSFEPDSEIFIKVNDEFYPVTIKKSHDKNVYSLGKIIFYATNFYFELKLDPDVEQYVLGIYEKINNIYIKRNDLRYHKSLPLSNSFSESYFEREGWYCKASKGDFVLRNSCYSIKSLTECLKYEKKYIEQLEKSSDAKNGKMKQAIELRKKIYPIYKEASRNKTRRIWLITDRVNKAGDNGEALFIYLSEHKDPEIDVYFAIDKNCPDFERMKQYGKVIDRNSDEYKMMFLLADVNISSHADEFVIDPFYNDKTTDVFRSIVFCPKYVFLQHGITKDDISSWVNRFNKDIQGLITAANPEYDSFLTYDYFYTEKEIWLTGFPRYDRLYHNEKRYITIMPTWRQYLSKFSTENENVRVVVDNFKSSSFYCFYNSLINNEKLISASKEYNYQICFMPHPNIMTVMDQFDKNPDVKFFGLDKPYSEIYAESDLVMTDYSSSVMDFAYLRKPVVYCHFDKEEFTSGDHVYVPGYFNYETDGFGEVTYDLDALVDMIIDYMKNECTLKEQYRDRIDRFFAFNDKNNCERVYKKVKGLY